MSNLYLAAFKHLCLIWFIFAIVFKAKTVARKMEFQLERLEAVPGVKETLAKFDWKVIKVNRARVLNGTLEYKCNLNNSFLVDIWVEYSPLGNNQFIQHPFKTHNVPVCEFHKDYHRKYGQQQFQKFSDYPVIPPEGLCPIPKGIYTFRNFEFSPEKYPEQLPRGLWKAHANFILNENNVGGVIVLMWVRDK